MDDNIPCPSPSIHRLPVVVVHHNLLANGARYVEIIMILSLPASVPVRIDGASFFVCVSSLISVYLIHLLLIMAAILLTSVCVDVVARLPAFEA